MVGTSLGGLRCPNLIFELVTDGLWPEGESLIDCVLNRSALSSKVLGIIACLNGAMTDLLSLVLVMNLASLTVMSIYSSLIYGSGDLLNLPKTSSS